MNYDLEKHLGKFGEVGEVLYADGVTFERAQSWCEKYGWTAAKVGALGVLKFERVRVEAA